MKTTLNIKLVVLWIYFITTVIVGNIYFPRSWHVVCEILQIINMCIVVYLSSTTHNSMCDPDRKLFRWFVWSTSFLLLSAILYFIVNYLLHITNVNNPVSLAYIVPSYLWIGAALVYWGITVKKFQVKNNWIVLFTIILVNLCLAYMIHKLPLKPTTAVSYQFIIFQTYTNIVSVIIFNLALCALICASNIGIRLLAAGFISMIGANFLTAYIVYTYNPSSMVYRNDFWLFSSCILITGLLFLKNCDNHTITLSTNERSIKNIIVGWTLSIIVLTASLFLGLANYFYVLTPQMLSVLPYIMFIYIIFAVFMSLAISYIFEAPIREINKTIHNFIEHTTIEKPTNRINISEFMVLNDFILYTMGILEERNNLQKDQAKANELQAYTEAERLKFENEANKSKVLQLENEALQAAHTEQEKFRTIVAQMMHDITSPLTSLDTIIRQVGSNLPEADRVTLRSASDRISGIANSLLSKYKNVDSDENVDETLLASLALIQILNEKKYEHGDKPIKFEVITKESSNFRFIKMNGASFKRMVSNIINNAVDALGNTPDAGININLGDNGSKLILTIKDNGPGMPEHIQEKFKQGIGITEGKAKGHGLGLTQVKDAVETAGGRIDIIASAEHGTRIVLVFPIIPNPAWLATEIKLTKDDTVVILDDDESIHGSWDSKFAPVLEKIPSLKIQHFTQGQDAIAFINSKTPEEQQDIFLLTDKELLNQDVDGLGVIEQIKIKRVILVTSYATQTAIQTAVIQAGIKLLPKELSHAATITVDKKIPKWSKKVDMVWLEDQTWFLDDLVERYYKHLQVDKYYDPVSLMEDIHQYPLDTRIILDTYYETVDKIPYAIDGFRLAKQLHELGYTNLILYGGEDPGNVEAYLKVVLKTDRDMIDKLDRV